MSVTLGGYFQGLLVIADGLEHCNNRERFPQIGVHDFSFGSPLRIAPAQVSEANQ